MISMSDLKHDAIVNSGIPINKRYEIPEDLVSLFSLPCGSLSLPRSSLLFCTLLLTCIFPPHPPTPQIPPDSRVEIDAKIAAGYFSTTSVTDLSKTAGRLWEDLQH
jgi:hypothetical protein